jgi:hypothetical protein
MKEGKIVIERRYSLVGCQFLQPERLSRLLAWLRRKR